MSANDSVVGQWYKLTKVSTEARQRNHRYSKRCGLAYKRLINNQHQMVINCDGNQTRAEDYRTVAVARAAVAVVGRIELESRMTLLLVYTTGPRQSHKRL